MYILTGKDVASILRHLSARHLQTLHDALSQALIQYSRENQEKNAQIEIHQPHRSSFTTSRGITSLVMPVSDTSTTGVKVVTLAPGAAARGAITVYSAEGDLLGVLNAEEITAFRTALASMVALKHFVKEHGASERNVVVFGAGRQAEWHIRLVLQTLDDKSIANITVVNRSKSRLDSFQRDLLDDLSAQYPRVSFKTLTSDAVTAASECPELRFILSQADVIFGTTPSTQPLFPSSFLKDPSSRSYTKNRFISLIGSYKPNMQEIDTETVLDALRDGGKIVVDTREACLIEAGELIQAKVTGENVVELGELRAGMGSSVQGHEAGNFIFKCVGMALMDMVVGNALIDIAKEVKSGMEVSEF
ncbi:ornithine cyclodeaminase/mu-crystallin family protein [Pyrenochaeta sp. DS3sAY3a]|nr:ornithine cyclodeaminase/mu-crystallin family protein [Pyrenochaeta sp. DS3sAY3a]